MQALVDSYLPSGFMPGTEEGHLAALVAGDGIEDIQGRYPMNQTHEPPRANKALVPTAGAALSAMLSVALTRHPVSTLTPAPAVGTA